MVVRLADLEREDAARAKAAVQDIGDARRRLLKHPVKKWAAAVPKLEERRQTAAQALTAAETAAKSAALKVATGAKGAEEAHTEAHRALAAARGEDEMSAAVLSAAQAELEASTEASLVVNRADYAEQLRQEFEADKARAREWLTKFEANLAALRESDRELRNALGAVSIGIQRNSESWQGTVLDVAHIFRLLWVRGCPEKWPVGLYDAYKSDFAGSDTTLERREIPTFTEALAPYL